MAGVQNKAREHEFRGGDEGTPGENYHQGSASIDRGYQYYAESLEAYLVTISRAPLLSPAAERRLARRVRDGCPRARNELIERNMRLVVYGVKRYRGLGLDFEELIQEGTFGLIRAAEMYDPAKGYRFSTYATWWIRQKASRAVFDKGRIIRIPVHYQEQLRSFREAERALSDEQGREPTTKELAERLEASEQKVEGLRSNRQPVASLDAPTSGGEDGRSADRDSPELGSFLADSAQGEEPLESAAANREASLVYESLAKLDETERFVLCRRYGLEGNAVRTLGDIASELCTHREFVRKQQKAAERKIKAALIQGRVHRPT